MIWVIVAGLACGIISLIGGIVLIYSSKKIDKVANYATAFAAGALLSTAFVGIIPEAIESEIVTPQYILLTVLGGLLFFFLLEGIFHRFHSHAHNHCDNCQLVVQDADACVACEHDPSRQQHQHTSQRHKTTNVLLNIGDGIHNFIDGIAIAAAFLINTQTGFLVTLSIIAHEIPQEFGDFAIMLNNGTRRRNIIYANLLTSLLSALSAIIFYAIGDSVEVDFGVLLAVVAGFFIYIATTDIIPTIQQDKDRKSTYIKMGLLVLGVIVLTILNLTLHQHTHSHDHDHDHGHDHVIQLVVHTQSSMYVDIQCGLDHVVQVVY
jgi:zinc and cadmium transporter